MSLPDNNCCDDPANPRLVTVETVFAQLRTPLALRWTGTGGKATLGATRIANRRIPMVGYLNFIHPPQVQIIGEPEAAYLADAIDEHMTQAARCLTAGATRLVVVADGQPLAPWLRATLDSAGVAVFQTAANAHRATYHLRHFLGAALARRTTVHGVFLEVLSTGLLLVGDSGVGKSELALELINRGHRLVADDAPEFAQLGPDELDGSCPPLLQDFLEVRGLGILNIRAMFGEAAIKRRKPLGLIIRLVRPESGMLSAPERLAGSRTTRRIFDVSIPEITLPVAAGRNLAVLVEAACRDHLLRLQGHHSDTEFAQRQQRAMKENPE